MRSIRATPLKPKGELLIRVQMSDCRAGSQARPRRYRLPFGGSLIEAEGKSTDFLSGEILVSLNSGCRKQCACAQVWPPWVQAACLCCCPLLAGPLAQGPDAHCGATVAPSGQRPTHTWTNPVLPAPLSPSGAPVRLGGDCFSPDWLMWPKELPTRADGLLGQRELSDTLGLGHRDAWSLPVHTPRRGGSFLPSGAMARPTLGATAHQTSRIYKGAEGRSLGVPWDTTQVTGGPADHCDTPTA